MDKIQELREARQKYAEATQLVCSLKEQADSIQPRSGESFHELLGRYRTAQEALLLHRDRFRQLREGQAGTSNKGGQLVAAFHDAFEPYTSAVKAVQSTWAQFGEDVQKVIEPFRDFQRVLAALPKDKLEKLRQAVSGLGEEFRKSLDEEERTFFAVLAKRGWIGLEEYYTSLELRHIVKLGETGRKKSIDTFVCRTFREGNYKLLNQISKGWMRIPYLKKRRKIILQALRAHRECRYALSIPTLLPLVDGLAVRIVGRTPKSGKAIYVKDAAKDYRSTEPQVWSEFAEKVVTKLMYKSYDFEKRPPSSVNRHAIMHGEVISYSSEANSLRVILLLDTFSRLLARKLAKH